MIKNNICIISESDEPKSIMFNNIVKKYSQDVIKYDNFNIHDFMNSIDKYISFTYTNNLINIFNTHLKPELEDNFENNIKIIDQCTTIVFFINCNNYKSIDIEKYYYVAYTQGIKNVIFYIYNLDKYPTNDKTIRFKDCEKYLLKQTRRIGIKDIKILEFVDNDDFDISPLLLNLNLLQKKNYNSLIITNKFSYNSKYDVINGTVRSGTIKKNDALCVKPENIMINIKKIEINHNEVKEANMYDIVGMLIDKNENIKIGNLLVNFNSEIKSTNKLLCKIIVIEDKININDKLLMHYNHNKIGCTVNCIYKNLRLNISNKDNLPNSINKCKVGIICIDLLDNIYINKYDCDTKEGRVLFINEKNKLSCIGIIKVIK